MAFFQIMHDRKRRSNSEPLGWEDCKIYIITGPDDVVNLELYKAAFRVVINIGCFVIIGESASIREAVSMAEIEKIVTYLPVGSLPPEGAVIYNANLHVPKVS